MSGHRVFSPNLYLLKKVGCGPWTFPRMLSLLAMSLLFQHEAAFVRAETGSPSDIPPRDDNAEQFRQENRGFSCLDSGRESLPTAAHPTSPSSSTFVEAGVFFHVWQGGLEDKVPKLEFKGEGWRVDPRGKTDYYGGP